MRLATLKIMRVINDKIYPRGKWMSFTNTTRQVVQFAFSAGRDSVAVLVWRGDRAVARISKSAVSRVSNPQTLRRLQSRGTGDGSADWKSAVQQVGNLRYVQRVLNRYPSRPNFYPLEIRARRSLAPPSTHLCFNRGDTEHGGPLPGF